MTLIIIVLVVAVAGVLAAAIFAVSNVIAAKKAAGPTRELATANSLLERILAYDDAATSLSIPLRQEAESFTRNYRKELS